MRERSLFACDPDALPGVFARTRISDQVQMIGQVVIQHDVAQDIQCSQALIEHFQNLTIELNGLRAPSLLAHHSCKLILDLWQSDLA